MSMSDPIADMLTRIRNANTAKHDTVDVPASKMKIAIADILVNEGYIAKYELSDEGVFQNMHITLKYGADKNEKIITGLKRISKPGLRIYVGKDELPRVLGSLRKSKLIGGNWYVTYWKTASGNSCRCNSRHPGKQPRCSKRTKRNIRENSPG